MASTLTVVVTARNKNNMASTSCVGRVMRRRSGHVVVVCWCCSRRCSSIFVWICLRYDVLLLRTLIPYAECFFPSRARLLNTWYWFVHSNFFCTRVNLAFRTALYVALRRVLNFFGVDPSTGFYAELRFCLRVPAPVRMVRNSTYHFLRKGKYKTRRSWLS
jgi:hypothetical protein